uniref:Uncharacterized protein n=1 Tax=Oryza barthii TaxID=65489 RepID=A0A0D3ES02_9ORYZ
MHYENGGWFDDGECTATWPVNKSENGAASEMAATEAEFYRAQAEEFPRAMAPSSLTAAASASRSAAHRHLNMVVCPPTTRSSFRK